MKYIRTKDGKIFDLSEICIPYQVIESWIDFNSRGRFEIDKQANTIEELCDEFVLFCGWGLYCNRPELYVHFEKVKRRFLESQKTEFKDICYGAIWTEWGLKYVAKMNEKGELELI